MISFTLSRTGKIKETTSRGGTHGNVFVAVRKVLNGKILLWGKESELKIKTKSCSC